MPNPFGGYQIGTLPAQRGAGPASSNGVTNPGPVTPSDSLLVANDVMPDNPVASGTALQVDTNKVSNRISISIQNQGSATVEVYFNTPKPTFGSGGWQILAGGWFEFNYTENVKVYVVTGGTSCQLSVLQNVKR